MTADAWSDGTALVVLLCVSGILWVLYRSRVRKWW